MNLVQWIKLNKQVFGEILITKTTHCKYAFKD